MTTFDTRELPDDIPPHLDPSGDKAPWACEICGQPVPPTASGRKPRLMRCDDHRKSGGTSASTSTRSGGGPTHERIKTGMMALHGMVAFGVGMVSLPTGSPVWAKDRDIITANSENISEQWAKYCDTNPAMRKAILKFLDTAGSLSLIGAYAPVALAIGMNHKAAANPVPVPPPVEQMPQAPRNPFQPAPSTPVYYPPTQAADGSPVFQPSMNGNGLPFATDVIE